MVRILVELQLLVLHLGTLHPIAMTETRPSALKHVVKESPGTPSSLLREPLMGSPVQSPPSKTSRVGEHVGMETGFAQVPAFPQSGSASGATVDLATDGDRAERRQEEEAVQAEQARLAQLASTYEGRA